MSDKLDGLPPPLQFQFNDLPPISLANENFLWRTLTSDLSWILDLSWMVYPYTPPFKIKASHGELGWLRRLHVCHFTLVFICGGNMSPIHIYGVVPCFVPCYTYF